MEPSTRILPAQSYPAEKGTKYVTTHSESHYILKADTREELVRSLGDVDAPAEDLDLDLTSTHSKFLFKVDGSFYHFFIDSLPVILKLNRAHPWGVVILYVHRHPDRRGFIDEAYEVLKMILDGEKIEYRIIETAPNHSYAPIIKINNFAVGAPYFDGNNSTSFPDVLYAVDLVIKYTKKYLGLENKIFTPTKKVFLSSEPDTHFEVDLELMEGYEGYKNDIRMHDRERLEQYFASIGFEVIDPVSHFNSLFEQIAYMREVKVLAAVTCSGLANMIFMKPGGHVIEIQAEIVQNVSAFPGAKFFIPMQGVHTMYSMLSYMKDHLLFSVPSHRDPDKVIERISNSKIMEIL